MTTTQKESVVTAWEVQGEINYDKFIEEFGAEPFDEKTIERFEKITKKPIHPWIKRGIVFCHRDINGFLDAYEKGEPLFIYTGRGPSSGSMHLGHLVPFLLTKYLQDVFDCIVIIQISDDEKYYFKDLSLEMINIYTKENVKDIIACGFNPEKTFIFSNRDYRLNVNTYELFVTIIKKYMTANQVAKTFGFGKKITGDDGKIYRVYDDESIGKLDWPCYQIAAGFSTAYPHIFDGKPAHCLIPCAADQDVYIRTTFKVAEKMRLLKPYAIITTFLPSLHGLNGKMSSSNDSKSVLYLSDTIDLIKKKIMSAVSGSKGMGSAEDHKKYGGDTNKDVCYQYLKYFKDDDVMLQRMKHDFEEGLLSCLAIKEETFNVLNLLLSRLQKNRENISEDLYNEFFKRKPMKLPKLVEKSQTDKEKELYEQFNLMEIKYETYYHNVISVNTSIDDLLKLSLKLSGVLCKTVLLQGNSGHYYILLTKFDDPITATTLKSLCKNLIGVNVNNQNNTNNTNNTNINNDYDTSSHDSDDAFSCKHIIGEHNLVNEKVVEEQNKIIGKDDQQNNQEKQCRKKKQNKTKNYNKKIKLQFAPKNGFHNLFKSTIPTIFAIMGTQNKNLTVLIDENLNNSSVYFHPLRSDASTKILMHDLKMFINKQGYEYLDIQINKSNNNILSVVH